MLSSIYFVEFVNLIFNFRFCQTGGIWVEMLQESEKCV